MLLLQDITYLHPDKTSLFSHLHLSITAHQKAALVGNNGTGKSTLLKIISGQALPQAGTVKTSGSKYYIPQNFGQLNDLSVAQAMGVENKTKALRAILDGDTSDYNFEVLDEDWTIEERCREAWLYWQLDGLSLDTPMQALSGGQKTKVLLSGIDVHQPELVLLDEPSNHLDQKGRHLLYDFIQQTTATLLVVSHDRQLLQLLNPVYELNSKGIKAYGGNYAFYRQQKEAEENALVQNVKDTEKTLRKAREKERETLERQQKLDARGARKQEKAGVARIMMNTLRNSAENSTAKTQSVHAEKIAGIASELQALRSEIPEVDKMKLGLDTAALHSGKLLFRVKNMDFGYGGSYLWHQPLDFEIRSGERIALKGENGSGKTTLIKLLLGIMEPPQGEIFRTGNHAVYIDQDYSLIRNPLSVYQQAQTFNHAALQEHEVKIRLVRFLFDKDDWDKPCQALSGGERMRLALCCLTLDNQAPDMIVLDEPTNNLDIRNIEILTAAIKAYTGTLLVVSHDTVFLEEIGITREIQL